MLDLSQSFYLDGPEIIRLLVGQFQDYSENKGDAASRVKHAEAAFQGLPQSDDAYGRGTIRC
ncbi:hypothetical protein ACFL6U_19440 [Planctomycetota bacterium]